MATTVTTPTPGNETPVSTATTTPELSPQAQNREAIYSKYYGETTPTQPAEPAAPTEPVVSTATTTIEVDRVAQLEATVAALNARLEAQSKSTTPAPSPAPAPVEPPVKMSDQDATKWVELLAKGDYMGATQLLQKYNAEQIQPMVEKRAQEAVTQAVEAVRVENDIRTFVAEIRTKNSDVTDLEPYIASAVEGRLQMAMASGEVKTPTEYAERFKKEVAAEVENARKVVQKLRGSGKTEAQVVHQEVLAQTPVTPSETVRGEAQKPTTPQPQSSADWIKDRQNRMSRMRGLSVG